MNGLQDKVILVTGAASGLGYADAEFLTESGATVVMTDINEYNGKALGDRLGNLFLGQNVSDEHRWSEVMSEIRDRFGRLDGLVNNAGIAPIADIETTTTEVWRQTLAVHLDGTFLFFIVPHLPVISPCVLILTQSSFLNQSRRDSRIISVII